MVHVLGIMYSPLVSMGKQIPTGWAGPLVEVIGNGLKGNGLKGNGLKGNGECDLAFELCVFLTSPAVDYIAGLPQEQLK